jgi:TolB-like protein/Tfp pilus assembly protein PilF
MQSLIPGYEYDIFISYRQKDNKGDRWVSEFVEALRTELESTFKDEISVYFDINPHDGLLETHDVDASLKEKLKCAVFIPIISRTYCDPKSFAWEHEFKAFIEQASQEKYGLKVKLPGGNIANRVLPIQIHDLDSDDKKLIEGELGGFLRGIEFIYKEPGVNRPLRANEDHPDNNLNKTFYRNQINKVANAIKEIITGLNSPGNEVKEKIEDNDKKLSSGRNRRTRIITVGLLVLTLLTAGYFIVSMVIKQEEPVEKSIAVLPFNLLSSEPDKQYLADGMVDAITLHLSKIKDLRVLGRTSTEQFRNPDKTLTAVGKELDVSYLLEGSFQKFGDSVRLIVQLIRTGKEGHVWANNYDRQWKNVFAVQSEVARAIAGELKAVITPQEMELIEKIPTASLTALNYYLRGNQEQDLYSSNDTSTKIALKRAEEMYRNALKYDPGYALAYCGLAKVYTKKQYWNEYFSDNFLDSVLILCNKALSFDDKESEAYTIKGNYYREKGQIADALREYDKAIEINPNGWEAYAGKAPLFEINDFINYIYNYQKAASLNHGPGLPAILRSLTTAFQRAGFIEQSEYYAHEALNLDNDSSRYFSSMLFLQMAGGNFEKALAFSLKAHAIDSGNLRVISEGLGFSYMLLGQYQESLEFYKIYLGKLKASGSITISGMGKIGYAYYLNGFWEEADFYFDKQIEYCNNAIKLGRWYSQNLNTYYDLASVYAVKGEKEKALENISLLNQYKISPLWMVTFLKNDPLFDNIRDEQGFKQVVTDMESKYQAEHERVRKWLEEQGTL